MECPPVALSLHEPGLDLPLLEVVGHPISQVIVDAHVAEIVQFKVLHARVVPVGEGNVLRGTKVLVLLVVGRRHDLEAIANEVTVKLHKQAD